MLIFWLAATLLAAVTLGLLLWPLLRRGHGAAAPDADSAAIAVYRDQKQALDAECADGVISTSERDAAVAELAHRLGDELAASPVVTAGGHRQRLAWVVALALLLLLPSAAVVLYARLGNPAATTVAAVIDGQNGHEMSASQITAMVDRLAERLKSHPDEAQGWVLLARSYAALGRYAEAADAYAHADALIPDNADLLADYADALAMAQGKRLAGKPAELAQRALTLDPQHKKGLALAASAALEARDFNAALAYWRRLLAQVPEGSDDAKQINAIIAEVEAARDGQGPAAAAAKAPRRNVQVAAAPAATPAVAPVAATIAGRVDIAPDLAAKVALSDTVFIYARAVDGPRMPLAVLRVPARELPKQFRLDDSMGMAPGVKLSNAAAVIVEARISKSGNALPQPGDLSGKSAPVKPGANDVNITIDQVVP
jgi:cytochrome c-type biogenesis protein CcmH